MSQPVPVPLTRARLREIAGLARRRERARLGHFLVEGVRGVEAAVAAGAPLVELVVTPDAAATPRVAALLGRAGVPVSYVSAREFDRLSDAHTGQGLAGLSASVVVPFDASIAAAASTALVLDGVQDPGNVGTILRTAAWFGIELVVTAGATADPESPKVVRSAAGALWDLGIARTGDAGAAAAILAGAGFALHGADAGGAPLSEWQPGGRAALVLGGEADGISPGARLLLDGTVAIAHAGAGAGVESLNVAVAAGILMHRWRVGVSG